MSDASIAQSIAVPVDSPDRKTPLGPLWFQPAAEGSIPLRIRRLPAADGLLKLGATLQETARSSHPRLRAPTKWWRDDDGVWISGPRPDGRLLSATDVRRHTWSDAVDAIAPLAVAVQKAHRRGLVHAHLAPWNVLFDEATGQLSALDFGTWPFEALPSTPFRPPEMTPQGGDPHPTPATDVHNLARLLIYLALSAEQATRSRPNFETLPAYAISTLERALSPDPRRRPQTIDELLGGLRFQQSTSSPDQSTAETLASRGRARDIEEFEHPDRGVGLRFHLDTPDGDEPVGCFVYRQQQPDVFESLSLLWEGAEVNLVAPREIEKSDGTPVLTATDETLVVIEPNWPVSVSDVLKTGHCPQRVMVDVRDPGERTHHLPFGTLVHQFLEDLTEDPALTYREAIERRLPDLRLDFLACGVDDEHLEKLLDDARRHFEHLRRFTARRTAEAPQRDRVGWCGEHVEATRYSSRYGLEGRTDLVVTDSEEGLQIIELKSGKPWHDHPGQVRSYALLWRQLASRRNLAASGFLLYSKNGQMKEVPLESGPEQKELIFGRNRLIALYRSFVDPDYEYRAPYHGDQPKLCRENACRFRRDRCENQTAVLELSADEPSTKSLYHRHFTRLIEMERWAEHAAMGAIFRPEGLAERVADNTAAADLELYGPQDGATAVLEGDGLHIFSPGDRLLVHRGDVDGHHVLRARAAGRLGDTAGGTTRLQISPYSGTITEELAGPGWIADRLPARIGYRTAHRAVYRILEDRLGNLRELLLSPGDTIRAPAKEEIDDIELHPDSVDHLDASQRRAVQHGLTDRLAMLVQGPPGTGKTTVIGHLCAELADRRQRVLLSALTNTAVDTMLIKLMEAADARNEEPPQFLRVGRSERSPLLKDALEKRGLPVEEHFSDDLARKDDSLDRLFYRLKSTRVIATTAHSALRDPAVTFFERQFDRPAFDVALVDEAAQLTEPMALAPLSCARRFVLVGDHRQLPPIVTAERALGAFWSGDGEEGSDDSTGFSVPEPLRQAGVAGLDRSLFERLAEFLPPQMLTTQYRMHRSIMAFPAHRFYDGRLEAHESVADRTLQLADDSPGPLDDPSPVVFADVDGMEAGRVNPDEARAVIELIEQLVDRRADVSIGVLSPYRAQVHLIRRLLEGDGLDEFADVDTVERFQGNERDVILASLVKTDHPGEFLADPRRINVALTRAKKKLIILGSRRCIERAVTLRRWLEADATTEVSWSPS